MQRALLPLLLGMVSALFPLSAQDSPPADTPQPHIVQTFEGVGSMTTAPFQVQNKWEVKWNCMAPLKITIYSADHNVVAGTVGVRGGSFFLAAPGTYYLQMEGPAASVDPSPTGETIPGSFPPSSPNPQPSDAPTPSENGSPSTRWHVQVAEIGGLPSSPLAALTPPTPPVAPVPPPVTVGKLTEDQARAVVLISGDNSEGTGFLIKTPQGAAVVTNIHVISNNPHLKITTNTGAQIAMLSARGASDRDLVLLDIKDAGYNYLDVSTDISRSVQPGDEVITPGNSQGGEVMLNTPGKVLGIGPERIEFDNPIYHGNSGGPVFHTKTGKVLGVVTEAIKVDTTNDVDKVSFASRNSAISGGMRYFGMRLDTVSAWIPIDWNRFQIETTFLDQFHDRSRYLDSYLNGRSHRDYEDGNDETANLYRKDDAIMKANDRYQKDAAGSDIAQRIEAARGLLFDLQGIADSNLDQVQIMENFYPFDQERARDELSYRQALKHELDKVGDNVERLGSLPRTNNN